MPYAPDALEATRSALQAALAACEAYDPADSAPLDEALVALEQAVSAMKGNDTEEEDMDMSKMDMAAKSPEDKATLKAKLAKAAFGGYGG
jgi:hypothetical protein